MDNVRLAKILKIYIDKFIFKSGLAREGVPLEEYMMGNEAFLLLLSHGRDGFAHDFYIHGGDLSEDESYNVSKATVCSAIIHLLCLMGEEAERKGDKVVDDVAWKMMKTLAKVDPRTARTLERLKK